MLDSMLNVLIAQALRSGKLVYTSPVNGCSLSLDKVLWLSLETFENALSEQEFCAIHSSMEGCYDYSDPYASSYVYARPFFLPEWQESTLPGKISRKNEIVFASIGY